MRSIALALLHICFSVFLISCSDDDGSDSIQPIEIEFISSSIQGIETDDEIIVQLTFSKQAPVDGSIELLVNELTATYGIEFTTEPASVNSKISLPVLKDSPSASVSIFPKEDMDSFSDAFELVIASTSNRNLKVGENRLVRVTLSDKDGDGGSGQNISCNNVSQATGAVQCTPDLRSDLFDIVTWNIENFPMRSNTITKVIDIIENLDADVYAIQEIGEISAFNSLVASLSGYSGIVIDVNGRIETGFIFKDSEIASFGSPSKLFSGQTSPFPREPVSIDVTHVNGLTVKLINIHLKCCGGSESRRTDASNRMKDYIDTNFPDDEVIILGDWNEDIDSNSSFINFMNDTDNYIFADQPIADGSSANYSYPSWPSHIDHILVTNELCDNLVSTYTVRLGDCVSRYSSDVSDHRPVMVSLSADN